MALSVGSRGLLNVNSRGMGARDIDLELLLNDPAEARKYIELFDWSPLKPPKYVVIGLDEKILLAGPMSDEEAVFVAKTILRDVEIPAIMREKQLAPWGLSCWEH
jgi:hypothetical protein